MAQIFLHLGEALLYEIVDDILNWTMHPAVFWGIPFVLAGVIEVRRKLAVKPKKEQ